MWEILCVCVCVCMRVFICVYVCISICMTSFNFFSIKMLHKYPHINLDLRII